VGLDVKSEKLGAALQAGFCGSSPRPSTICDHISTTDKLNGEEPAPSFYRSEVPAPLSLIVPELQNGEGSACLEYLAVTIRWRSEWGRTAVRIGLELVRWHRAGASATRSGSAPLSEHPTTLKTQLLGPKRTELNWW